MRKMPWQQNNLFTNLSWIANFELYQLSLTSIYKNSVLAVDLLLSL